MAGPPVNEAAPVYRPFSEREPARPASRPQPVGNHGVQLKPAHQFHVETRPAPPVYRPQQTGQSGVQPKAPGIFMPGTRPAPPVARSPLEIAPASYGDFPRRMSPALSRPSGIPGREASAATASSLERIFHSALSVLQLSKKGRGEKEKKPPERRILTRILHPDQLSRRNIGISTTRRSKGSLRRNLPLAFTPLGGHTSTYSGLFSFMRKYGGP